MRARRAVRIGGRARRLNLEDPDEDPLVAGLSLADATSTLGDAMHRLPQLAAEDERRPLLRDGWRLELDHQPDDDVVLPPGLAGGFVPTQLAPPLSTVLEPMTPDRLTVVDDDRFRAVLASERNVPQQVRTRLLAAYGAGT